MQGLKDAVRKSPLNIRKHGGKYSLIGSEQKDPFTEGITFNCQFVGSTQVKNKFDHPDTRAAIKEIWTHTSNSKSLKRMTIRVKADSLRVKDIATKTVIDELPIYRVSYCGTTSDMPNLFYYIHRDKEEPKRLTAELFRMESHEKVKALILTVQKAFNIAYKVWQAKKRQQEKKTAISGTDKPSIQVSGATGGSASPQLPKHADLVKLDDQPRRNSDGELKIPKPLLHPSIAKIKMTNEVTGSMHELHLTDDFDDEFTQLAQARSHPDLLDTSMPEAKPNNYRLDAVKDQFDPGSIDNLLDL
ncbi:low density lipoprotein receptor adapter protein 1-like [Dysidea avara]|uniref:low density lipoprotein receptor adapter protein 1-like n=1 Tax=Dysidea avara TaxID=196820 RepID=UPI00331E5924